MCIRDTYHGEVEELAAKMDGSSRCALFTR